jgi:hypothetical protein
VICQTPPHARFQLNNGNIPFPRIPLGGQHNPAKPGKIRVLGQCLHQNTEKNEPMEERPGKHKWEDIKRLDRGMILRHERGS